MVKITFEEFYEYGIEFDKNIDQWGDSGSGGIWLIEEYSKTGDDTAWNQGLNRLHKKVFYNESFGAEKKSGCMHYKYGKHKWAYTQDGKICIDCGNQGVRSRDGDNSKFRSYAESFGAESQEYWRDRGHGCMICGVVKECMTCNKVTCECELRQGDCDDCHRESWGENIRFASEHGSGQDCCFCGDTIIGYGNKPCSSR